MIIVKLIGGLGNQMFQYAAGRTLAMRHKTDLFLDTSHLNIDPGGAYTARNYELGAFNISAKLSTQEQLDWFDLNASKAIVKLKSYFPGLFKSIIFNESQSSFDPRFFKLPSNSYLNGYWQAENYFSELRETLIKEFGLKYESETYKTFVERVSKVNSVSVHVRHGDYVSLHSANLFHGVLPLSYYKEAMDVFQRLNSDPTFFVFSDNLAWCRENFGFIKNAVFIDGKELNLSSQEELLLMSHCQHNIIANSSFSWWAAWLNTNTGKKIIAPKNWFNKEHYQPKELIPSSWIRL